MRVCNFLCFSEMSFPVGLYSVFNINCPILLWKCILVFMSQDIIWLKIQLDNYVHWYSDSNFWYCVVVLCNCNFGSSSRLNLWQLQWTKLHHPLNIHLQVIIFKTLFTEHQVPPLFSMRVSDKEDIVSVRCKEKRCSRKESSLEWFLNIDRDFTDLR